MAFSDAFKLGGERAQLAAHGSGKLRRVLFGAPPLVKDLVASRARPGRCASSYAYRDELL
jgi:hypothetical protein